MGGMRWKPEHRTSVMELSDVNVKHLEGKVREAAKKVQCT
jgi:hypothetical protein